MQVIPLLALALARAGAAWPRAWIAAGSAAWVGLAIGAFVQAQAGRPFGRAGGLRIPAMVGA